MKTPDEKADSQYGISRFDCDKHHTHGWRVSLRRHGKMLVENFPDKKYGGRQAALKLARQFRDELLGKYPPISRKEMCLIRRSNNKSGINGVCTYAKRYKLASGSFRETWYWEASWPAESGGKTSINFSVRKYGNELARSMAIRARIQGIERLEGAFWASERGFVEPVEPEETMQSAQKCIRRVA